MLLLGCSWCFLMMCLAVDKVICAVAKVLLRFSEWFLTGFYNCKGDGLAVDKVF